MAAQLETRQLLEGVVAGNPFQAFGISPLLPPAQLRRECRQRQANYHQDRGNPVSISQLANGCADVICGRAPMLTESLKIAAKPLLEDICKQQGHENYLRRLKEWVARDRQAHHDRITYGNKGKAELLIGTFEHVSRSEASPIADVRQIFQRAFGLSSHEAGWVMKEVGIRSEANYKKIRVAIKDSTGLRIPTKTDGCSECPMCGYCWDSKSA
jgi:hypothetical protein